MHGQPHGGAGNPDRLHPGIGRNLFDKVKVYILALSPEPRYPECQRDSGWQSSRGRGSGWSLDREGERRPVLGPGRLHSIVAGSGRRSYLVPIRTAGLFARLPDDNRCPFNSILGVLAVLAARVSDVQNEGPAYLRSLSVAFLYTVGEAVLIAILPLGRQGGSRQFQWVGLIVIIVLVAVLFIVAALAAISFSDTYNTSYFLDIISGLVSFRQRLSPGFGLIGGEFGQADIRNAVPSTYPRGGPPESRRSGSEEDSARGNAWAQGLRIENKLSRPRRWAPTPAVTSVGFVRLRRAGAKLAVINYFETRRLFQAWLRMPRKIEFSGQSFPVVARPWLPVYHGGPVLSRRGEAGDGRCWVTFGEDD